MMITKELFTYLVLSWTALAILLFPFLLKITAPYGRHSKSGWGPMINNRLGWFVMELPALLVFGYFVILANSNHDFIITIASALWMLHYTNRSLVFPLRLKTGKKKMPVAIVAMAFFFNLVNGSVNGYWLGFLSPGYPESWCFDPRFIIGLFLFLAGFILNQYYDHQLIKLRKKAGDSYIIPQGGLFNLLSCPNLFGELIEWGGFALLSWNFASLSFFVWTAANLIPRALDHHRWYLQNFKEYPKSRKAILIYLW